MNIPCRSAGGLSFDWVYDEVPRYRIDFLRNNLAF